MNNITKKLKIDLQNPGSTPIICGYHCVAVSGDQHLSIFPIRLHVDPLASAPNAGPENNFYVTGFLPTPDSGD